MYEIDDDDPKCIVRAAAVIEQMARFHKTAIEQYRDSIAERLVALKLALRINPRHSEEFDIRELIRDPSERLAYLGFGEWVLIYRIDDLRVKCAHLQYTDGGLIS